MIETGLLALTIVLAYGWAKAKDWIISLQREYIQYWSKQNKACLEIIDVQDEHIETLHKERKEMYRIHDELQQVHHRLEQAQRDEIQTLEVMVESQASLIRTQEMQLEIARASRH